MRQAVRLQKKALLFTDEHSKLEGELLNGIDVVKCNSWEVSACCGVVLLPAHGCAHQPGALLAGIVLLAWCHVAFTLLCGTTACRIGLGSGCVYTFRNHLCHWMASMATTQKPV